MSSLNVLSMKISIVGAFGVRGGGIVGSSMSSICPGDSGICNISFSGGVCGDGGPGDDRGGNESEGDSGGEDFFRGGGGRGRGTRFCFLRPAALLFIARSSSTAFSSEPQAQEKSKKHGHFLPGQETSA